MEEEEYTKCDVCGAEIHDHEEVFIVDTWICCSEQCLNKKLRELYADKITRKIKGE